MHRVLRRLDGVGQLLEGLEDPLAADVVGVAGQGLDLGEDVFHLHPVLYMYLFVFYKRVGKYNNRIDPSNGLLYCNYLGLGDRRNII